MLGFMVFSCLCCVQVFVNHVIWWFLICNDFFGFIWRFHVLAEFDEAKRSCRRRLAGHNKRRRKPQPDPLELQARLQSTFEGIISSIVSHSHWLLALLWMCEFIWHIGFVYYIKSRDYGYNIVSPFWIFQSAIFYSIRGFLGWLYGKTHGTIERAWCGHTTKKISQYTIIAQCKCQAWRGKHI